MLVHGRQVHLGRTSLASRLWLTRIHREIARLSGGNTDGKWFHIKSEHEGFRLETAVQARRSNMGANLGRLSPTARSHGIFLETSQFGSAIRKAILLLSEMQTTEAWNGDHLPEPWG